MPIEYCTVTGVFQQDDPSTDPDTFDYINKFGLIPTTYPTDSDCDPTESRTQWQRFAQYIDRLNREAPAGVQYKMLYLGRHGEGNHNVAEALYGTKHWDEYWSKLEGNDTMIWADPELTDVGIAQARVAREAWMKGLAEGLPAPQSCYASPMRRCLETAKETFVGLELPAERPFKVVVKELLRETLGVHTCDRRSDKTVMAREYPEAAFEEGFVDKDPLWDAEHRETGAEIVARLKMFLDDVFRHDRNTYISFSSHSGAIAAILAVVGHRPFRLQTGAMIPVLVKATVT